MNEIPHWILSELSDEIRKRAEEIISEKKFEKIPKWDKGISCPYFHILYAHINYFALPSPPLNSE